MPDINAISLLGRVNEVAEIVTEKAGMNIPYCESIDIGDAFPVTLQLAIDPDGFDSKEEALDTLHFLAENDNLFPASLASASLEEFSSYLKTHRKEILETISSQTEHYYSCWSE